MEIKILLLGLQDQLHIILVDLFKSIINDGLGYFTDESLSKMGEQPRSLNSDDPSVTVECITHGEGALFLRDYEGDGDLDIFDQTAAIFSILIAPV